MRFCHSFTLTAGSRGGKQAPPSHRRIGLKRTVQCDQPHLIVLSPPAPFSVDRSRVRPRVRRI